MKKILVLGLGNEFLSDDAIGIIALRKLKEKFDSIADFQETAESGLALIDYLIGYQKVLILDSIKKNIEDAGTIELIDLKDMEEKNWIKSPHYIGLPFSLKIAKNLKLKLPKIIKVLAMLVEDPYTIKEGLTEKVKNSLPFYISLASSIIEKWLKE